MSCQKEEMKVVTEVAPTDEQWEAMLLGWKVVPSVKSNAIILSNNKQNCRYRCWTNESCRCC